MKTFTAIIFFSALSVATAFAQGGDAGFQILETGFSARSLSLGSSNDAITDEPVAIYTNPAGLATLRNPDGIGLDFMLTHRTYLAGTTIDMFGTRFQGGGLSFGTSLLLSSVPDIEVREVPGDPISTFAAKDFAFAAGVARSFGKLDIGISALYLYEKLFVYQSTGYALNFGIKYSPMQSLELGLSAGNLGSSSAMISQEITLPAFLRIGGSYTATIDDNLSAEGFLEGVSFRSGGISPAAGMEINLERFLRIRAGYSTGIDLAGWSFGAGLSYGFLQLDYSYIPLKLDFGNSQTFTLSFIL